LGFAVDKRSADTFKVYTRMADTQNQNEKTGSGISWLWWLVIPGALLAVWYLYQYYKTSEKMKSVRQAKEDKKVLQNVSDN
jgi:hypothetical protein